MATGNYTLPPPIPVEIHSKQAGEKWKRFRRAWDSYSLATGLSERAEDAQVATLLTVIGEEAREVYSTFTEWENEGDSKKIAPVLQQFERYCEPRKNVPFERYRFNRRSQEPGESYDQYRTALRKLAEGCGFASITPDEMLRDRLVFGIRDSKTRERLLREPALTLKWTDEICHAAESMVSQLKLVEDDPSSGVNVLKAPMAPKRAQDRGPECPNCGQRHDPRRREACPAFGKACRKRNHFAVKCRSQPSNAGVCTVQGQRPEEDEDSEAFPIQLSVHCLDDAQLVTLLMASGSSVSRWTPEHSAMCCHYTHTGRPQGMLALTMSQQRTHESRHMGEGPCQWLGLFCWTSGGKVPNIA